jgi:hypothetical protein
MIIKSMSRKHPSFAQLIDYIEGDAKLKSREYSIHHNLYTHDRDRTQDQSRDTSYDQDTNTATDRIKQGFEENARHLRRRKNGVYLYHEILSMSRSQSMTEDEQKRVLKQIVESYLHARGKHNMAYAVMHEDTQNLHFHICMSANAVGDQERTRLSKAQFANIQIELEKYVLKHYPQMEQRAVFHQNQTPEERAERMATKDERQRMSDKGEQVKRRGGQSTIRDQVQERLTDIFETATDPRHFTELLEKAGFTLYTRGQSHGVTDSGGNKYRLARLGLADSWQRLDAKMRESYRETQEAMNRADEKSADTPRAKESKASKQPSPEHETKNQTNQESDIESQQSDIERERLHRLREMESLRAAKATKQAEQTRTARDRGQDRER